MLARMANSSGFRKALEVVLEKELAATRTPGAAVGVWHAGQETLTARGVTNAEHRLDVDERTLFQIASNSKTFTATLVMQLVERGQVDLDRPVQDYLPRFRLPDAARSGDVLVRHLLTHRVGWDGDELFVRPPGERVLSDVYERMSNARQLVPPGSDWTYNNAGFSVAGHLVETLHEKPFDQVLRSELLEPLGMNHTFTRADQVVTHRVASPHLSSAKIAPVVLRGGGWQPGWEIEPHDTPAAGLVSCVDDLLRWLRFHLGELDSDSAPLSRQTLRAMHAPAVERWNADSGHAIGWAIWYAGDTPIRNHGGLTAGYCTLTLFSPEHELAAVFLTNSTAGGRLHRNLSRFVVSQLTGAPTDPPEPLRKQPPLQEFAGVYRGSFGLRTVTALDRELELTTRAHSTEDGSWQPPADPPLRLRFYEPDLAVVVEPETHRGMLVDFGRSNGAVGWLRLGARIHTREAVAQG